MAAIDSYFAVYNDDNILTIDDNYKNLVYAGTFYPNQYKNTISDHSGLLLILKSINIIMLAETKSTRR